MVTNIDEAKNLAYMLDRREHTKQFMVQTNPPQKGDIETLKARVESVEGEELLPNIDGQVPIMEREWVSLWNGH